MIQESLRRLQYLCEYMPNRFSKISEEEFSYKPSPEKWSKKEILGHLIDSATNNHQRFVRTQFEVIPRISYDGDQWVSCSRYQSMSTAHLIETWKLYNHHLIEVVQRIPDESLNRMCDSGDPEPHPLAWLFDDYVVHMEHHLHQLVDYS